MPFMSHACMEPVSCTARVGDQVELWLSTKSPSLDAGHAARALGVDPSSIVVHNEYQGGDFGRRSGMEHTTEAVLLAKATGRAVKVIWTREEDLRIDQHRTAFLGRARLGLGADGMPIAYEAKIACDGLWQRLFPWFYAKKKPVDLPTFDLVGSSYGIPNEAGTYVNVPLPVRIGAFRGNNDTHNGFMLELMIDDAAREAGIDPLAYRRRLLAKDARSTAVLDRAAAIAGWGKTAAGHHQGVAFWQSDFYRCRLAVIVEVSGTADALKVERLIGVCDFGLAINPMLAERAVEAGMIFGLSNAMSERITLSGGAPEQTNFDYLSASADRPGSRYHRRDHLCRRRARELRRGRHDADVFSSGQRDRLRNWQTNSGHTLRGQWSDVCLMDQPGSADDSSNWRWNVKKKATYIVLASAIVAGAAAAPLAGAGAASAQDAAAGKASFAKCQACHAVGHGAKNKLGPELNGLAGRKAGAAAGYQYSPALKNAGFTWDQSSFAAFMQNPRTKVPGNKMVFAGMKDQSEIASLWAYLSHFNADGSSK